MTTSTPIPQPMTSTQVLTRIRTNLAAAGPEQLAHQAADHAAVASRIVRAAR
jgi:hypothetical protein